MAQALLRATCLSTLEITMHRAFAAAALLIALSTPALASAQSRDLGGEQAVLDAINARRAAQGIGPLAREAHLDAAALVHSAEMADRDVLEHVSQGTGTPADRVHAAGLETAEIAENVAMHHTTEAAQQSLEASAAHLSNMLNPRFTHIGIASVHDDRGLYLTQVFARIEAAPAAPPAPPEPAQVLEPAPAAPVIGASPSAAAPDAIVVQPPSGGSATVMVPGHQPGRQVTGYWVCANARWYYYPLPPGALPGAQLAPDLSITGPPPGFAPGACAPGTRLQAGAPVYAAPAPAYAPPPVYAPAPPVYVPPPRGPRYIIVQPRPGAVVAPYIGGPGIRVELGVTPHPRGRVRVRRGWR